MENSSCIIRLQNPVLESVSFFRDEQAYSILCRFPLRGKLRHALVRISDTQWRELLNLKYESGEGTPLLQRLNELRSKQSWAHINLLHSFPYFSQSNDLTLLLKSSLDGDNKSKLELLEINPSGIAA